MSRAEQAGVAGGLVGLVATGVAVGLGVDRWAVGRSRRAPDPDAAEPFFALPADRVRTVVTDDGVSLHVEEVGAETAPLTVVFSHGWTQQIAVWHYQRKALAHDPGLRLVLYDQRGHGRSGRGAPERSTIDQLGRDLDAVLTACVPRGPVVLVGHSMGGMTTMALAAARPELFGPRVTGVALVGTSAGLLSQVTLGLPAVVAPVTAHVLPWLTRGVRRRPSAFERTRRLGTDLAFVVARRLAFGTAPVSPSLVEFVEKMTAECPVDVIAEFYDTFSSHDKLAALGVLGGLPVLVLVGSRDLLTPPAHSRAIAQALPLARLVEVEGAGHMVALERAPLVTHELRALIAEVTEPAARSA